MTVSFQLTAELWTQWGRCLDHSVPLLCPLAPPKLAARLPAPQICFGGGGVYPGLLEGKHDGGEWAPRFKADSSVPAAYPAG